MIPKQDRIKPRTPEDLVRQYGFKDMKDKLSSQNLNALIDGKCIEVVGGMEDGEDGDFLMPLIRFKPTDTDVFELCCRLYYANGKLVSDGTLVRKIQ